MSGATVPLFMSIISAPCSAFSHGTQEEQKIAKFFWCRLTGQNFTAIDPLLRGHTERFSGGEQCDTFGVVVSQNLKV